MRKREDNKANKRKTRKTQREEKKYKSIKWSEKRKMVTQGEQGKGKKEAPKTTRRQSGKQWDDKEKKKNTGS